MRDADHPFGRVLDDRIRTGGDNPDQRYLFAPIRGGEAYRVRGRKGSAARIELQLYSREPYGAEDVSVGYLPDEAIEYGDDATFTVELGPDVTGPGSLVNPPDATILNIRQIWSVWDDTDPGAVYVDRVGWEGARKLTDSPTTVAARIRGAADDIRPSRRRTFSPPDSFSTLVSTFSWLKPIAAAAARTFAGVVPGGMMR